MFRHIRSTLCLALALTLSHLGFAGYGLTAEKTFQLKNERPEALLFIDVRDPVEIQFTGFTDAVDLNIPYLTVDRHHWVEGKHRFSMDPNPDFLKAVVSALRDRGLEDDALIVTMCRSGSARGEPSAAYLRENGFTNAHFVIHGFQGDVATEGPNQGFRRVNGWQNSGLPWSHKMDPQKVHKP